jgi:COP9 signalosome complex subunit 1
MGYNDLGDFHYGRGDLQHAFKCYVRTRDYCTTSKHIISMCLNVILVSIELGHFVHVSNYVSKADQTPDVQDPVVVAKLKCAAGLAYLESKKYKLAARKVRPLSFPHRGFTEITC